MHRIQDSSKARQHILKSILLHTTAPWVALCLCFNFTTSIVQMYSILLTSFQYCLYSLLPSNPFTSCMNWSLRWQDPSVSRKRNKYNWADMTCVWLHTHTHACRVFLHVHLYGKMVFHINFSHTGGMFLPCFPWDRVMVWEALPI